MNEHFPSLDNQQNTKKDSSINDENSYALKLDGKNNNEDIEELRVNKEF